MKNKKTFKRKSKAKKLFFTSLCTANATINTALIYLLFHIFIHFWLGDVDNITKKQLEI